jgi:hypothetical protein
MDCINETIQINSVIGCRSLVLMSNSEFIGEGGNLNSTASSIIYAVDFTKSQQSEQSE